MAGHAFLRALWGPATLVVAFLGAGVVALFSFAMGLLVDERILWWAGYPLAALLTGVAATLAASWTATLLAPDRSRTRLWSVLRWSEAGALAGLGVFYLMTLAQMGPNLGSRIAPLVVLASGAAAFTAIRQRTPPHARLRRDALASLGLLLLIPAAIYALIGVACLADQCGA